MGFSYLLVVQQCVQSRGGGLDPRTAIEGSFSAWGGLGKPDRGLGHGETFFPDSGSNRDSDETFQISRNLGLEHVEFVCLLDSQLCVKPTFFKIVCFRFPTNVPKKIEYIHFLNKIHYRTKTFSFRSQNFWAKSNQFCQFPNFF